MKTTTVVGGVLSALLLAAPVVSATPEAKAPEVVDVAEGDGDSDPLEGMNRGIFWFNEQVDRWALKPVATAWDFVLPDPVQRGIDHILVNASFPIRTANCLLQGKPKLAGIDVARFGINTTIGVVGIFDPAARFGLEFHDEDFGQTLGVWGLPPGPYLMLPFLGPSTVRDGLGLAVDSMSRVWPWFAPFYVSMSVAVGDAVNDRSLVLGDVDEARAASLDFYAGVRSAYLSRRRAAVADADTVENEYDLYFYDEPIPK